MPVHKYIPHYIGTIPDHDPMHLRIDEYSKIRIRSGVSDWSLKHEKLQRCSFDRLVFIEENNVHIDTIAENSNA